MQKFFPCFLLLCFCCRAMGQVQDSAEGSALQSLTVTAFGQERKLRDAAAAIGYISNQNLQRFSSASPLQAINILPGVRMEERSPGSYRLNIRGSSLRSPFGVRNVKVYYNDLPFTDPGGQTYLNALGYYNFQSLEVIKGPGSSLYGAGTGGVLLIEGLDANEQKGVDAEITVGSFGLLNLYTGFRSGGENAKQKIGFQHQQSGGYRNHSALERNIFSWNGRFATSENAVLKTTFLYSHLTYKTPGALTLAEFRADPTAYRPAAVGFPSAASAQAAIRQQSFLAGVSFREQLGRGFINTSSAYGMYTALDNPAIRNYGQNRDPHVGGRTDFRFARNAMGGQLNVSAGGEIQQGFSSVSVYRNRAGRADSLQSSDEIPIRQGLLFAQLVFAIQGWEFSAGGSLNFLRVNFLRHYPTPLPEQQRLFSNELAPRISVSHKWRRMTLYASVAEGFSPPASAELFPSGSAANLSLNPEQGTNHDIGLRGTFGPVSVDVNAFYFRLRNTLAQRRDAGGGDYYVNAGRTSQTGVETSISAPFLQKAGFVRRSLFWMNHTWHRFRYTEFKQLTDDFSGKRLPGTAPHSLSAGVEAVAKSGWFANLNYFFSDRIALNDANSEYAHAYHLLAAKFGFEDSFSPRLSIRFSGGVENLLDQTYSLGNDINAFGGRYYNAAPRRNIYLSFALGLAAPGTKR